MRKRHTDTVKQSQRDQQTETDRQMEKPKKVREREMGRGRDGKKRAWNKMYLRHNKCILNPSGLSRK